MAQPNHVHEHYHVSLVEHALGKESVRSPEGYLRRHSVQVVHSLAYAMCHPRQSVRQFQVSLS